MAYEEKLLLKAIGEVAKRKRRKSNRQFPVITVKEIGTVARGMGLDHTSYQIRRIMLGMKLQVSYQKGYPSLCRYGARYTELINLRRYP